MNKPTEASLSESLEKDRQKLADLLGKLLASVWLRTSLKQNRVELSSEKIPSTDHTKDDKSDKGRERK